MRAAGPGRELPPGRSAPHLGVAAPASATIWDMNETPTSTTSSSSRSLGRMVVAVLILAVAAWVLLHIVIGIVTFLAIPVIVVAAIVAIVWAVRVLF